MQLNHHHHQVRGKEKMAPEVGPETKRPGKEHEVLEAFSLSFFSPQFILNILFCREAILGS